MSDINIDISDEAEDTPAIRQLREALARKDEQVKEGVAAQKKLAFLEAGVDLKNPATALLMEHYSGDLSAEAVREEAAKFGLVAESEPTPEQLEQRDEARERRLLQEGSTDPGVIPEGDPMDSAYAEFQKLRREGKTSEQASVAVFGKVFEEAKAGNERFIFDRDKWAEEARAYR